MNTRTKLSIAQLVENLVTLGTPDSKVENYFQLIKSCAYEYSGGHLGTWYLEDLRHDDGRRKGWKFHLANSACMSIELISSKSAMIHEGRAANLPDQLKREQYANLWAAFRFLMALMEKGEAKGLFKEIQPDMPLIKGQFANKL
jgi:hypothetical protein